MHDPAVMLRQVALAPARNQPGRQPVGESLSRQSAVTRAPGQDVYGYPQAVLDHGLRQQRLQKFGLPRPQGVAPEQLDIGQGPQLAGLCRRQAFCA